MTQSAYGNLVETNVPATAMYGSAINVHAAVKNTGAQAGFFTIYLTRSGTVVDYETIGRVGPGETSQVSEALIDAVPTSGSGVTYTLECIRVLSGTSNTVDDTHDFTVILTATPSPPPTPEPLPEPQQIMKLTTPALDIATLKSDFVDIKWDAVPTLSSCNADPMDAMLYSVWFDGNKQADRIATHADFDDLTPRTTHTIEVQATPRADWDCEASDKASISFTTPAALDALLHIVTRPEGAMVDVNSRTVGSTDLIHSHPVPTGNHTDRVAVKLHLEHFKDKLFNKTLRPGMHEYALYRLSPAHKIKGKTRKSRSAGTATFTFTIFNTGRTGTQVYEAEIRLTLLNQLNGQIKTLVTNASGVATVAIPYADPFFASGRQKIVCIMDNTADRIRTFRTITVSKVTEDSVDKDEDWHEEDDKNATDDSRSIVDDAYAGISS